MDMVFEIPKDVLGTPLGKAVKFVQDAGQPAIEKLTQEVNRWMGRGFTHEQSFQIALRRMADAGIKVRNLTFDGFQAFLRNANRTNFTTLADSIARFVDEPAEQAFLANALRTASSMAGQAPAQVGRIAGAFWSAFVAFAGLLPKTPPAGPSGGFVAVSGVPAAIGLIAFVSAVGGGIYLAANWGKPDAPGTDPGDRAMERAMTVDCGNPDVRTRAAASWYDFFGGGSWVDFVKGDTICISGGYVEITPSELIWFKCAKAGEYDDCKENGREAISERRREDGKEVIEYKNGRNSVVLSFR